MSIFMDDITEFNQFINIDSIDMRIINYIKNSQSQQAEKIWKLLAHSDDKALFYDNLTLKEKNNLIFKDGSQNNKRIFNMPLIEDSFVDACSIIKIYINSVEPVNHLLSTVNVQIDILSHDTLSNIYNDEADEYDNGRPIEYEIPMKNRNNVLLKLLLQLLNGANIEGVGVLQLNRELSQKSRIDNNLSNKNNFYGYSLIMSCHMSGVGECING